MSAGLSYSPRDADVQAVLDTVHQRFPEAEAYRFNSASIRLRIIDDVFSGMSSFKRHDLVDWYLNNLPPEVESQLIFVLLLTPDELTNGHHANHEFDNPSPDKL